MERVEVVVVGAGVAGAAAAWALGSAGREALVVERFSPGHDRGSSHGPTRIFRFAYDDPFYVGLAQRTLPMWRALEEASGRALLTITGGLDVGRADDLSSVAAALRTCGAPADVLSASELRERFPGLDLGDEYALFSPDAGVLAAQECVAAMLSASGVPIRSGAAVTSIADGAGGVTLSLEDGSQIAAGTVILAAGGWSGPLWSSAGIEAPLQVSREQVSYFEGGQTIPVVIDRGEILRYFVPPAHGAPGAKAGEHGTGERTTADGRSFQIDPEGQARVCEWMSQSFPAVNPAPVAAETCLYTLTPDEDFVIGRRGNIVFASACSGHGFKFGPLIGEILAALAFGQAPPVPIDRFSPGR
ncbi:MAG: N-methyl-L-tryptophan oxidase, partial [Actinomycetota bacterium]